MDKSGVRTLGLWFVCLGPVTLAETFKENIRELEEKENSKYDHIYTNVYGKETNPVPPETNPDFIGEEGA